MLNSLRTLLFTGSCHRASRRRLRQASSVLSTEQLERRSLLTTFTVTNLNDSGAGSLRQAIADANSASGADEINFDVTGQITLTSARLIISDPVTINGPGADLLAVSGGSLADQVLEVNDGGGGLIDVTIRGITIRDGGDGTTAVAGAGLSSTENLTLERVAVINNEGGSGGTGGILRWEGSLTVRDSLIAGNTAEYGAIWIQGSGAASFINSTISGNMATANPAGGAITVLSATTLRNSTITGNQSDASAGGIFTNAGLLTLHNSIVAGNTTGASKSPSDVGGNLVAGSSNNLIGHAGSAGGLADGTNGNQVGVAGSGTIPTGQVLSTTLADNGGPTLTHALAFRSPAIDAGLNSLAVDSSSAALVEDQRGRRRIVDGDGDSAATVDIGAVEYQAAPVAAFSHWAFNEDSGSTVANSAGSDTGTINGATRIAAGETGFALSFDGTDDSVDLGTGPSLSGTTDFTVSAWIRTSSTSHGVIVQQRDTAGFNGEYVLDVKSDGRVGFFVFGDNRFQFTVSSTEAVNDGAWHHISAVRRGDDGILYIDGNEAGRASGAVVNMDPSISVHVGADVRDSTGYFNGIIDDVRIFDEALTSAEAADYARRTFTVNDAGDGGDATPGDGIAADASGNTTLRAAIEEANALAGDQKIVLDPAQVGASLITLTNQLAVFGSVEIDGPGADKFTISGGDSHRIFDVQDVGEFVLSNVTLADSSAQGILSALPGRSLNVRGVHFKDNASNDGSGIQLRNGTAVITNSAFTGNTTTFVGSALSFRNADATVLNTTISGNSGGPAVRNAAIDTELNTLRIHHSTIVQNTGGSAVETNVILAGGRATTLMSHTILADNPNNLSTNGAGTIISQGYNISDDAGGTLGATGDQQSTNPQLGPLQNHGGPTPNYSLTASSPAVDAGDPAFGSWLTTDQRGTGFERVRHGLTGLRIDIGAHESTYLGALVVDTDTDVVDGDYSAGQLSLREAIEAANERAGVDMITVAASQSGKTVLLQNGQLELTDDVSITGPGAAGDFIVDAQQNSRVFRVSSGVTASLQGLTATGGDADAESERAFGSSIGGGILNSGGTLTLRRVRIFGNSAYYGAGINNYGTGGSANLYVFDSAIDSNNSTNNVAGIYNWGWNGSALAELTSVTISGNTAAGSGAGLATWPDTTELKLANVTVAGNVAAGFGGGVAVWNGATALISNSTIVGNQAASNGRGSGIDMNSNSIVTVNNSLVAGNRLGSGFSDIIPSGPLQAGSSNNLIGDAASAGNLTNGTDGNIVGADWKTVVANDGTNPILADNGGPTQTVALLPGSPAIDAGNNALAVDADSDPLLTDQRGSGLERIVDGNADSTAMVDIGAFEAKFAAPVILGPSGNVTMPQPTITWQPAFDASMYEVYIENLTTGDDPLIRETISGTSYIPATDLPLGQYRAYVRGKRDNGSFTAWSPAAGFSVATTADLSGLPSTVVSSRPTLTWPAVTGADHYDVWINLVTTGQNQFIRDQNVAGPSFTPAIDLPIGRYQFFVRAIGPNNFEGTWTGHSMRVATFAQPASLTGESGTFETNPRFDWDSVPGAATYDLWVRRVFPNQQDQIIRQRSLTTTEFTATGALPYGRYVWWVQAADASGNRGNWTPPNVFWTGGRTAVLGPASGGTDTTPTIVWTPVTGADRYQIQIDRVGGPSNIVSASDITGNSYTPSTPLAAGHTYRVWVRAISNADGNGVWSPAYDFSIAAVEMPSGLPSVDDVITVSFDSSDQPLSPGLRQSVAAVPSAETDSRRLSPPEADRQAHRRQAGEAGDRSVESAIPFVVAGEKSRHQDASDSVIDGGELNSADVHDGPAADDYDQVFGSAEMLQSIL